VEHIPRPMDEDQQDWITHRLFWERSGEQLFCDYSTFVSYHRA
jgi:hypothetical protein